jgi:heme-degrading monooxygenase HmoA
MDVFDPPCYAVIFTSLRSGADEPGYAEAAERMVALAAQQPGYLGIESVRDASGLGITVSYWRDEESIRAWKRNSDHTIVREHGRETWYAEYTLHIARVERSYRSRKRA